MNAKLCILLNCIVVLLFVSCESNNEIENNVNFKLVKEFEIDSSALLYQYYQRFGFTDACEEIRMVCKENDSPKLNGKLPINKIDLNLINNFPNKVDKLDNSDIFFHVGNREIFYDIELGFTEYSKGDVFTISRSLGEYEIIETNDTSILKMYNPKTNLFYIEIHRCK